jgi:hypothetical protein
MSYKIEFLTIACDDLEKFKHNQINNSPFVNDCAHAPELAPDG